MRKGFESEGAAFVNTKLEDHEKEKYQEERTAGTGVDGEAK